MWLKMLIVVSGNGTESNAHLEEPVVEREEEGLAEEVGDCALGDGHVPEAAAAEQVGEHVAGVV